MAQVAQLMDLASECDTSVMCFEREPEDCHCSLLIDAVMAEAELMVLFP